MTLLLDQSIARRVADALRSAGYAVHVAERGLAAAEDDEILELAASEGRIVISEDTDFGALLSWIGARAPSFVLLRAAEPLRPDDQAAMLIANLPALATGLDEGCIVRFARGRIRVRPLPISRQDEAR